MKYQFRKSTILFSVDFYRGEIDKLSIAINLRHKTHKIISEHCLIDQTLFRKMLGNISISIN